MSLQYFCLSLRFYLGSHNLVLYSLLLIATTSFSCIQIVTAAQHSTCLSVRRLLVSSSSSCFDFSPAGSWNSSSSSAFSFAMATTDGGKHANSATWIPKLWSHTPKHTVQMCQFDLAENTDTVCAHLSFFFYFADLV